MTTTASTSDLINKLAAENGATKASVKQTVTQVVDAMRELTQESGSLQIAGLGTLKVKDRPERQGRNPRTGDAMTIPASKSIGFTPAKQFKDAVNS